MRLDRVFVGMCLGTGAMQLLTGSRHWFLWVLVGIGILGILIYLWEWFWQPEEWDSMTQAERIADVKRRIQGKQ